jgi:hypothetical protein
MTFINYTGYAASNKLLNVNDKMEKIIKKSKSEPTLMLYTKAWLQELRKTIKI